MIFYRIISILIFPLLLIYLFIRILKNKEDKNRFLERLAITSQKREQGDFIWFHAVSVGEVNSALILVDELLKDKKIKILFTTSSLTSSQILAKKIQENYQGRVIHQFLPYDCYFIVKKFLNFWRPKKVIFFESEIWINFLTELKQRNIKTYLINARISDKSFQKWLSAKKFGVNIFNYFDKIFAQSKEDKNKFSQLSKQQVFYLGNLKSQAKTLKYNESELKKLTKQISHRKFWIAASTHKGEEEIIIRIHKKLQEKFADLLLILIPRHPNRADEIIDLFAGLRFSQRSKNQEIKSEDDIYLADSLGEIGLFYKLADFIFLGGSLLEIGGHNPFEPIKLDSLVISARKGIANFREIYQDLEQNQACILVENENELYEKLLQLLHNPQLSSQYILAAQNYLKNNKNIVTKIVERL